jgi:hypothetical protein
MGISLPCGVAFPGTPAFLDYAPGEGNSLQFAALPGALAGFGRRLASGLVRL